MLTWEIIEGTNSSKVSFDAAPILSLNKAITLLLSWDQVSALLGWVYFPLQILPGWVEIVFKFIPFTLGLGRVETDGSRGTRDYPSGHRLHILAAFAVVLLPLSLAAFGWAVRQAKCLGTLAQF